MVKRILKRIFVFAVIACLFLACVPSVAFADVVEFQEAAKMGATIVDLYGSVNNTSLAYEALSDGSALTVIENLYQNYASSAGDPYTLAAIGAAAAAAGAVAVVYDAITGKGYVQLYQEQYISSLDGFWDYTLSDMGLSRNLDGLFEWQVDQSGDVQPIEIYSVTGTFGGQPIPVFNSSLSTFQNFNNSFKAGEAWVQFGDTLQYGCLSSVPNTFCFRYTSNYVVCSLSSGWTTYLYRYNYTTDDFYNETYTQNRYSTISGHTVYYANPTSPSLLGSHSQYIPYYPTLQAGLADALSILNGNPNPGLVSAAVFAYPEYYVGDPLTAEPTITIPDPASPQYIPSPSRINTNIEWLPEWGNPLPDGVEEPVPGVPYPVTDPSILNEAVPEIWKSVVSGSETDPAPEPEPEPEPGPGPSEVFTPLLPVSLPSFNFSFSGIWHYVREWVSSLGAWFTTLFTIWNTLPYAMVVPVYATAVVVIVLGVYKRFFM